MKRKRGVAVLLLFCLMCFVTACGSGKAENTLAKADAEKVREEAEEEMKTRHQERTRSSQEAAAGEEAGKDGKEDDGEAAAEDGRENADAEKESRTSEEQDDETEEADEDGYIRGEVTGKTYESEWIGLRYELPAGYTMSGEDEMDAILKAGGSMLYEDKADDIVDYARQVMVYEMMAQDRYGNVLTLFVEKTTFDIDTYVAAIKMQMGNVDMMDITMDDGETVEIAGVEFEKYSLVLDYDGVKIKEDYYLKKKGDRMICMLTGYSEEEASEVMLGGFAPY